MPDDKVIEELIRKVEQLEKGNVVNRSIVPPYPVWNENSPAQLTANQNNYDPGAYAVLRMTTDATRNITGFTGGVKGRILIVINVGSNSLVLAHESANSSAENRLSSPNAANVTLGPRDSATLYYDFTDLRWRFQSVVQ